MMTEKQLVTNATGQKILVLGFGVEGQSTAKFFAERGAVMTVYDEQPPTALAATALKINFTDNKKIINEDWAAVVRSPGFLPHHEMCVAAKKQGIFLTSNTNLFLANTVAHVIGVTGTKGKGTTVTLITKFLEAAGKKVFLGGNIGVASLDLLVAATADSWVVLEMASFQLIDVVVSPHIAVLLMITSEHLDKHQSLAEYLLAKQQIVAHQQAGDAVIYNVDYPASVPAKILGAQYPVSGRGTAPAECLVHDQAVWLQGQKIIEVAEIKLPGAHNWENICAAIMAASCAGVAVKFFAPVLREFIGLEHRLEFVREKNGVKFYNDSFATNPESTIAAINAFSAPKILILGGSGKNSDFTGLTKIIGARKNIKAIIGIGDEWPRLKKFLTAAAVKTRMIENLTTMPEIMAAVMVHATAGDVVLLSPACASFGLFPNYKERGKQFKKAVNLL